MTHWTAIDFGAFKFISSCSQVVRFTSTQNVTRAVVDEHCVDLTTLSVTCPGCLRHETLRTTGFPLYTYCNQTVTELSTTYRTRQPSASLALAFFPPPLDVEVDVILARRPHGPAYAVVSGVMTSCPELLKTTSSLLQS